MWSIAAVAGPILTGAVAGTFGAAGWALMQFLGGRAMRRRTEKGLRAILEPAGIETTTEALTLTIRNESAIAVTVRTGRVKTSMHRFIKLAYTGSLATPSGGLEEVARWTRGFVVLPPHTEGDWACNANNFKLTGDEFERIVDCEFEVEYAERNGDHRFFTVKLDDNFLNMLDGFARSSQQYKQQMADGLQAGQVGLGA